MMFNVKRYLFHLEKKKSFESLIKKIPNILSNKEYLKYLKVLINYIKLNCNVC